MSYYDVLLFLHIAAAIVWIGGGVGLVLLGSRFVRSDTGGLKSLLDQNTWLSTRVFIPSSLVVLVLGILLVLEGPWSFGELWIVLALAGFAATFLTGVLVLKPRGDRINAIMERDGGMSAAAAEETRRFLLLTRIDYAVLFMVVADMVLKPTTDDVWTLLAMAAVIGITAALVLRSLRTSGSPAPAEA